MEILILLSVQLVVTVAGIGLVWRRLDRIAAEVRALREDVAMRNVKRVAKAPAARERAMETALAQISGGGVRFHDVGPKLAQPFDHAWDRDNRARIAATPPLTQIDEIDETGAPPSLSPDTARLIVLVTALVAPAAGLYFAAPLTGIVAAGLLVAAAALLVSLRAAWRQTAWFAAIAGGGWALVGLLTNVGLLDPAAYCGALVVAALAGVTHARLLRPATPGSAMVLFMATTALVLGAQIGMVGPAGAALGVMAMAAAAVGASTLRLEAMHLVAFAAAGIGVYLVSGQEGGDIWFTPAAAWAGAAFLGIAFVRVPALGPRGTAIAATGAIAPISALGAMFAAGHGLENVYTAGGAFLGVAFIFTAMLVLSARRHQGLAPLHLTLWALTIAAVGATVTAMLLVAQAPLEPAPLAALALGLVAIDSRWPDRVWRFAAIGVAALAIVGACRVAGDFAAADPRWPPIWIALFSFAAPASFLGLAAHVATRRAPIASAMLEAAALAGGATAAAFLVRYAFSAGAPALEPIGFVETGTHIAIWLLAALLFTARADLGAEKVRRAAAFVFMTAATLAGLACALAWVTPWSAAFYSDPAAHGPLAFAGPALAGWAHWLYWRTRNTPRRARFAFGAAAMLTAAWATLEIASFRAGVGDWVTPALGAALFAIAAGLNFLPGLATRRDQAPPAQQA